MINKKAQSLPIQTVIIMIIAIIAFVIIILIFHAQFRALFGVIGNIVKSVLNLGETEIKI